MGADTTHTPRRASFAGPRAVRGRRVVLATIGYATS
jgi:hypothetical protein